MGIISTKLRNSARGQNCQFAIPGICNCNSETVVLCHAPGEVQGMGSKNHDFNAAFGCCACHEALDQHKVSLEDFYFFWMRGMQRTWGIWVGSGLVVLPVDFDTAKRRPGRKASLPSRSIQSANTLTKEARAARARRQP